MTSQVLSVMNFQPVAKTLKPENPREIRFSEVMFLRRKYEGRSLLTVESRSALDQNTSWVIRLDTPGEDLFRQGSLLNCLRLNSISILTVISLGKPRRPKVDF